MSKSLEARLKSNLNIVLILFIIASIFSISRIFNLISTDTFHLQDIFHDKAYIPILIQGFGFLAIIVSSLLYQFADKLSESQQVIVFSLFGVALMPYTIILFVIGIMKFVEDNRYKLQFLISAIIGMILFGLAISILLM